MGVGAPHLDLVSNWVGGWGAPNVFYFPDSPHTCTSSILEATVGGGFHPCPFPDGEIEAPSENQFALPEVIQLVSEELGVEPRPPDLIHREKMDPI